MGRRAAGRDRPRGLLRLPGHAAARDARRRRHPPHRVADHPAVGRALPGTERHVVLVNGIEPNLRWRAFCARAARPRRAARRDEGHHARRAAHRHPAHPAHPGQRHVLRRGLGARAGRGAVHATRAPPGSSGSSRTRASRPASRRSRSGRRCRTTSSQARVPEGGAWRCCTASRRCSTSRCRSARCPSRPRSGSARVSEMAEADDEVREYVRAARGAGRGDRGRRRPVEGQRRRRSRRRLRALPAPARRRAAGPPDPSAR